MRKRLLFLYLSFITAIVIAQPIPQKASIGFFGNEIYDLWRKEFKLSGGILLDSLRDYSLTNYQKLKHCDVAKRIKADSVKTLRELTSMISSYREGDKVKIEIIRNG